jgi:hypothetical protein
MFYRLLASLLAASAALACLATVAAADPVFPPGLRIGLEPPGEMKLSNRFPGFEDSERRSVITILDLPASAYAELENAAFTRIERELEQPKRESFPFGSGIGFLISGLAQRNGIKLHRWSLLAKAIGGAEHNLTMLIHVEVPDGAVPIYSDAVIRKALASVTFRPAPIEEQLGLLPFKLGDMAGFRAIQVVPPAGVILTDGPTDNIAQQSYMIVSAERGGPAQAADRARFARDLLAKAPVRDLGFQSAEAMRINGAPGFEIRARAMGPGGEPVAVVQWLRFGTAGFLRVVGVSRADEWDQLFTRFRAVRDGISQR